jgi:hypothetical protein
VLCIKGFAARAAETLPQFRLQFGLQPHAGRLPLVNSTPACSSAIVNVAIASADSFEALKLEVGHRGLRPRGGPPDCRRSPRGRWGSSGDGVRFLSPKPGGEVIREKAQSFFRSIYCPCAGRPTDSDWPRNKIRSYEMNSLCLLPYFCTWIFWNPNCILNRLRTPSRSRVRSSRRSSSWEWRRM